MASARSARRRSPLPQPRGHPLSRPPPTPQMLLLLLLDPPLLLLAAGGRSRQAPPLSYAAAAPVAEETGGDLPPSSSSSSTFRLGHQKAPPTTMQGQLCDRTATEEDRPADGADALLSECSPRGPDSLPSLSRVNFSPVREAVTPGASACDVQWCCFFTGGPRGGFAKESQSCACLAFLAGLMTSAVAL